MDSLLEAQLLGLEETCRKLRAKLQPGCALTDMEALFVCGTVQVKGIFTIVAPDGSNLKARLVEYNDVSAGKHKGTKLVFVATEGPCPK